ncbi:MAG: hypothetical protein ACI8VW_001185 [bacterium]|jgi:hypothetical protein
MDSQSSYSLIHLFTYSLIHLFTYLVEHLGLIIIAYLHVVEKFDDDADTDLNFIVSLNRDTILGGDSKGYIDYPAMFNERKMRRCIVTSDAFFTKRFRCSYPRESRLITTHES